MIKSAQEFCRLRDSQKPEEYGRAANEEAPIEVWNEVIKKFPDMKVWVIHNKTVPVEILRFLSEDPDYSVRRAVANKRKCPRDLLERFTQDPDESVRLNVACNAKTPKEILEILLNDPWKEVVRVAKKNLEKRKAKSKQG